MPSLLGSYLCYARGEGRHFSPWILLNVLGTAVRPFVRLRNGLYDRGIFRSIDSPIPVISVGNLCHGGTNKTPMVEMIARGLMACGLDVGIVSRGYGGETKSPLLVDRRSGGGGNFDRSITGDEPLMLAGRLPTARVVVSRDRYDGVCLLAGLGVDVAVADDAFQHRRMGRDLDIVLIDATCPFGNGRLFPAGILREQQDALVRADVVILTKTEQAPPSAVAELEEALSRFIPREHIFTSRVDHDSWLEIANGEAKHFEPEWGESSPAGRFVSFSAIGNPESFQRSLAARGIEVLENVAYRDHHRFTWRDIDKLERKAARLGATGLICTEKDLQNLPSAPGAGREKRVQLFMLPLYVPRITVVVKDEARFWRVVTKKLRPRFVVASNGYGEDAIGALLASRLEERFPLAKVTGFALVGRGREYEERGVGVFSPASDMPSGGIVKYSLSALLGDLRHGLRREIRRQIAVWRANRGKYRTPICVGDVYLFAHTLFGQGLSPALVATAKTVRLSGHRGLERCLLRWRAHMVWTRDAETAEDLRRSQVEAVFCGNPIMDLALGDAGEAIFADGSAPWDELGEPGAPKVMLLPGSRPRAYDDIALLMAAVELLAERTVCAFVMVLAPTIEREKILEGLPHAWDENGDMELAGSKLRVFTGPIAAVAIGADLLIGLGGTANQVSAGLGVPVLSILEKGKLVQKKLLRDAELLVPATPVALADAAEGLLSDPVRRNAMARAGIAELGGPGAIDAVVAYAADELGWEKRCKLYETLFRTWMPDGETVIKNIRDRKSRRVGRLSRDKRNKEADAKCSGKKTDRDTISEQLLIRAARLIRIKRPGRGATHAGSARTG